MCLTLLGGGGGSRPSQTMSDFWPDLFLETAPKYTSILILVFSCQYTIIPLQVWADIGT